MGLMGLTVFLENATTELVAKTALCACHALKTPTWISANSAKSPVNPASDQSDASVVPRHLPNFCLVITFSKPEINLLDTHITKDFLKMRSEEIQYLKQKNEL